MASQQYRTWSDCTDVHAGLVLYWWQRLTRFRQVNYQKRFVIMQSYETFLIQ